MQGATGYTPVSRAVTVHTLWELTVSNGKFFRAWRHAGEVWH